MDDSTPTDTPAHQWFAHASPEQKRAALHILIAVATGDGKLTAAEKSAIAEACTRMGLSAFDVAEALVRGMPEGVVPPTDRAGRLQLLLDSAAVMVADRSIDDRELAVLLTVGRSLGFGEEEVTSAVVRVVRAVHDHEEREEVLRRLLSDSDEPPT